MKSFLLHWLLVLTSCSAFSQVIASKVYSWNHSAPVKHTGYEERTFLTGTTRDFSSLTVQAITLFAHQPAQPDQQLDEEAILLIREGTLSLTLGRKSKSLGPGSVVLLMPGDFYRLENKAAQPLIYYLIRYTSNEVPDLDLYRLAGGSFWVDGNEVANQPHDKGDSRLIFDGATVMSKRVQIHLNRLNPGAGSQPLHTHRPAEILILMDNTAQVRIDGERQSVGAGDLIFLESSVPHHLQNTSLTAPADCPPRQESGTYFALQFE